MQPQRADATLPACRRLLRVARGARRVALVLRGVVAFTLVPDAATRVPAALRDGVALVAATRRGVLLVVAASLALLPLAVRGARAAALRDAAPAAVLRVTPVVPDVVLATVVPLRRV